MGKLSDLLKFRKPRQLDLDEYLAKVRGKGLNDQGQLVPDPVPIAPPIGYKKVPSMVEVVREMVRSERLRQEALEAGFESLEDADDFDVGDDAAELRSGYENDLDPPLSEILAAGRQALKEREERAAREAAEPRGGGGAEPPGGGQQEPQSGS